MPDDHLPEDKWRLDHKDDVEAEAGRIVAQLRRSNSDAIESTRRVESIGLAMCISKPDESACSTSSGLVWAVRAMAGNLGAAFCWLRIDRISEYPSSSGMPMSAISRS